MPQSFCELLATLYLFYFLLLFQGSGYNGLSSIKMEEGISQTLNAMKVGKALIPSATAFEQI